MPDYVAKLHKFILKEIQREVTKASRPSGLAQSKIVNGGLDEVDNDDNLLSRIGQQYDDTHAPVTFAGPVPPTPAGVSVTPGPTSIKVAWDGTYADAMVAPLDWSAFEVHASPDADFVPDPFPDSSTRVGIIGQAAGGSLTFQPATSMVYVRCVSRSASGKYSDPTDAVDAYADPSSGSVGGDGAGSFTTISSEGEIRVGGMPLVGTMLDPAAPLGLMDGVSWGARQLINFRPVLGATIADGATVSVATAAVNVTPDRIYQFTMQWKANVAPSSGTPSTSNISFSVRLHYEVGAPGTVPEPTQNSPILTSTAPRVMPVTSGYDGTLVTSVATDPGVDPVQVRILLVLAIVRGSLTPDLSAPLFWIGTATDIGSAENAQIIAASTPGAGAVSTYVTTWSASDSRAWGNEGQRLDTGVGGQPAPGSLLWQNGAPGKLAHSAVLFNGAGSKGETKTIAAALAGAAIVRAELFLYQTWAETDDKPEVEVRAWTGTTLPATKAPPGTSAAIVKHTYTARSQGAWFDIPTSWISATQTGIWIASPDWGFPNAHTNLAGAIYIGPGWQTKLPLLRLTYRR